MEQIMKCFAAARKSIFATLCSVLLVSVVQAHPSFESSWIRLLPPNMTMTSAYVTIQTGHADRIISVSSDVAERVEMHETSNTDGMMNMRQVEALELSDSEALVLEPGGYHLMLIDLKRPLKEGETIPLTFSLEQSPDVTVDFIVRKP